MPPRSRIQMLDKQKNKNEHLMHTELGEKEEEHDNGRGDGDDTARESSTIKILIYLGVSI